MRLALLLFSSQLLLLEPLISLTEMTVLAWRDQGRAVDLAQVLVLLIPALALPASMILFGLEVLIVEVEFEVRDQWLRLLILLFFFDLRAGLEEASLLSRSVVEEERVLVEATAEEVVVEVGRTVLLPRCPWIKTLSLNILGVRVVGRGSSRWTTTA
jgi:hypothetical protein